MLLLAYLKNTFPLFSSYLILTRQITILDSSTYSRTRLAIILEYGRPPMY
jgi:hypothetical protein